MALPDPAGTADAAPAGPPPELTHVLRPGAGGAGQNAAAGQEGAPEAPSGAPPTPRHGGTYDHRYGHGLAYDMTGAEPDPAPAGLRRGRGRSGRHMAVAAGAVAAVLLTAAYASGLLTKDGGGDDRALPDGETTAPFVSAAPEAPEAPLPASPSRTRSVSPSVPPSPSEPAPASAPAPSATGQSSPVPLAAGPTPAQATATPTGATPPGPSSPVPGVTLRRGDDGPEVVELQERLEQAGFYRGRHDGRYNRRVEDAVAAYQYDNGIQDDPEGVYGPATRRALEAETGHPGDGQDRGDGDGGWDGW
ncbi:peptidoglycan-binding protein [Streptomyces sp. I6]|nr:peptidoglycan-binding protein [Streptomyces sp. I6]